MSFLTSLPSQQPSSLKAPASQSEAPPAPSLPSPTPHISPSQSQVGKFVIFCQTNKVNELWEKLSTAHKEKPLGYSLKQHQRKGINLSIITIHTKNIRDMETIGEIAWRINQCMGSWKESFFYADGPELKLYSNGTVGFKILYTFKPDYFCFKNGKLKNKKIFIKHFEKFQSSRLYEIKKEEDKAQSPIPKTSVQEEYELPEGYDPSKFDNWADHLPPSFR